jgi:hypothetical protein
MHLFLFYNIQREWMDVKLCLFSKYVSEYAYIIGEKRIYYYEATHSA